ncbi:glycosyltransferase family 4 protein [Citricoccus sp.]|uniref:glycosyltransferase family 4 protein n=1 Tax=Citricoccus sp. TaxID=1978372 RepID=UPI0028BDCC59|nr:glycosyltransferase family 4 protein [Citricoccus sp.]
MTRSETSGRRAGTTPWLRNLALTAQTVREHIVDDPVLLALQVSRRLPAAVSRPLASGFIASGRLGADVLEAIGHEMRGDRSAAWRALERPRPGASARTVPYRADAALGLADEARAEALLEEVDPAERRAAWFAAASRVAAYRGDLDGAAALAARHPRNRSLAKRAAGELSGFTGHGPRPSGLGPIDPVPGRVLHILTNSLPHTSSGYAQRSHSILRSLQQAGLEVSAVTRPGYPVQVGVPWAADLDTVETVDYARLLPVQMDQGLQNRLGQHAELLEDHVRRHRPSLLHTTTHFTNGLVTRAVAEATGIPWVYEVRGQLADTWAATRGEGARSSQRYREFVAREAEVARSADRVVTLGEGMRSALVAAGVDPERMIICPNAVGDQFLQEPPSRDEARAALGLEAGHTIIGTVSSIVDYEGLDLLVRATAALAPRHPGLRLRIAGDGVALPGLKVLARELGIEDRCDFPGRVARAEALMNHAALDVFVVPRKDLSVTRTVTPMKSVEASAVGRPVVAADLPALAELVQDGVTGVLFRPGDLDSLTGALQDLIEDPGHARELGQAGRQWALQTRTWRGNAERYLAMYRGLGVAPA